MEENKNESGKLNLPPLKKKATIKKQTANTSSSEKDVEAAARVAELLKDTPVASVVGIPATAPVLDPNEHKQERSKKWLEDQVDELGKQVEELQNEILYYKDEMAKMAQRQELLQQNNITPDVALEVNVINLFRHFENVYLSGYTDVKIVHPESGNGILDVLLQYFPQLNSVKRYRYRG